MAKEVLAPDEAEVSRHSLPLSMPIHEHGVVPNSLIAYVSQIDVMIPWFMFQSRLSGV